MYTTTVISPQELYLDEQNPRFKIKVNPTQEDIIHYMFEHENVSFLAQKMVEMDTLLPGERVIVFNDGNKNIVLEGNRRTAIYKIFLDQTLIPYNYKKKFPIPSQKFLEEIKNIPVDVVDSRDIALKYLAARHITGVEQWSSISKWRISHELFMQNKSIKEIADILSLSVNDIQKFIKKYSTIMRAISSSYFTNDEKKDLSPLDLKPDTFIRLFDMVVTALNLKYDQNYRLVSSVYSDDFIEELIAFLARKALLEKNINTRTKYIDVKPDIEKLLQKYGYTETPPTSLGPSTKNKPDNKPGTEPNIDVNVGKGSGGSRNIPVFFSTLLLGEIDNTDPDGAAVARIGAELKRISNSTYLSQYPISAAMLTRGMIEHSLIYYAKKHKKINGKPDFIFSDISNGNEPKRLKQIIEQYLKNLDNYIDDTTIKSYFRTIFNTTGSTNSSIKDQLDWVVHRPHEFVIHQKDLEQIPASGLLTVINYLIKK